MKPVFLYDKHMPATDDITLIVLKGHLLVEEVLFRLAEDVLPHPQYLKEANLTFHKLACIVRAAVPKRSEDVAWELILKLNSLRNDLAHNLESAKRQVCLSDLFKIAEQVQPNPSMILDKSVDASLDEFERLRNVVVNCMEFLCSLSFEYGRVIEIRFD